MQSKSNNEQGSRARNVVALMCVCGACELSPHVALGLTAEDVIHKAAITPWVWGAAGFVAGAATVAALSHVVHKAKIAELEKRFKDLEVAGESQEEPSESEVVTSEDGHDKRKTADDASMASAVVVEDADADPMRTQRMSPSEFEGQFPVIERGKSTEYRKGSTGSLDLAHTTEVMRRLDPATRARIIKRRIPSLSSLVGVDETLRSVEAEAPKEQLDPAAYIDRILQEEMERSAASDPAYARPRLTVIEGMAEPHGKHEARVAHTSTMAGMGDDRLGKEA